MSESSHEGAFPRAGRGRLGRHPGATQPTPQAPAFDANEVNQGLAGAVLGAMGRLQLRLDLLAREQSEALADVLSRLDALTEAVASLTPAGYDGEQDEPAEEGAHHADASPATETTAPWTATSEASTPAPAGAWEQRPEATPESGEQQSGGFFR